MVKISPQQQSFTSDDDEILRNVSKVIHDLEVANGGSRQEEIIEMAHARYGYPHWHIRKAIQCLLTAPPVRAKSTPVTGSAGREERIQLTDYGIECLNRPRTLADLARHRVCIVVMLDGDNSIILRPGEGDRLEEVTGTERRRLADLVQRWLN